MNQNNTFPRALNWVEAARRPIHSNRASGAVASSWLHRSKVYTSTILSILFVFFWFPTYYDLSSAPSLITLPLEVTLASPALNAPPATTTARRIESIVGATKNTAVAVEIPAVRKLESLGTQCDVDFNNNKSNAEDDRSLLILHLGPQKMGTTTLQCAAGVFYSSILKKDNFVNLGVIPGDCGGSSSSSNSTENRYSFSLPHQMLVEEDENVDDDESTLLLGKGRLTIHSDFRDALKNVRKQKKNAILVTEYFDFSPGPYFPPSALYFADKAVLRRGRRLATKFTVKEHMEAIASALDPREWKVEVLVGYRSLTDYSVSRYSQLFRPKYGSNGWGFLWPSHKALTNAGNPSYPPIKHIGQHIPPFSLDNRGVWTQYFEEWEKQQSHPTLEIVKGTKDIPCWTTSIINLSNLPEPKAVTKIAPAAATAAAKVKKLQHGQQDATSNHRRRLAVAKKGIVKKVVRKAVKKIGQATTKAVPEPKPDALLVFVFCNLFSTRIFPKTCQAVQQPSPALKALASMNPSHPMNCDILSTAAYSEGLISGTVSQKYEINSKQVVLFPKRQDVVRACSERLKRSGRKDSGWETRLMICLPGKDLERIAEASFRAEFKLFFGNDNANGNSPALQVAGQLQQLHRKHASHNFKKFCHIDATKILENPDWRKFFSAL